MKKPMSRASFWQIIGLLVAASVAFNVVEVLVMIRVGEPGLMSLYLLLQSLLVMVVPIVVLVLIWQRCRDVGIRGRGLGTYIGAYVLVISYLNRRDVSRLYGVSDEYSLIDYLLVNVVADMTPEAVQLLFGAAYIDGQVRVDSYSRATETMGYVKKGVETK